MEKAFKAFIKDRVADCFQAQPGWRNASAPKGSFIAGRGFLWKRQGRDGRVVYVFCQFHDNLNAVQAWLGWNRRTAFPSIDAVMENAVTPALACEPGGEVAAALTLVRREPEGWLCQHDLGLTTMFGLSAEVPSMSRLASVFDNPAHRREIEVGLLGSADVDWRQAKAFHDWGIIQHFDSLTAEDAQAAVGGTCEQLVDVLQTHYMPITDRFLNDL